MFARTKKYIERNYDEPKSSSGSDALLSSKHKYGLFTKKSKQTNQEKITNQNFKIRIALPHCPQTNWST